jgi:hypothetical protein
MTDIKDLVARLRQAGDPVYGEGLQVCDDAADALEQLQAELIPIATHHCKTTHSACDCVLKRIERLQSSVERYEKALKYYASRMEALEENNGDWGNRAREALKKDPAPTS